MSDKFQFIGEFIISHYRKLIKSLYDTIVN